MADEPRQHVIESPLAAWPGEIHLPHPDEFTGAHWETYKSGVNKPKRRAYATIHQQAYTCLEVITAHDDCEWQMEIPLAEVQAWENAPKDERTKLVAWIGREFRFYMDDIMNPKG